MTVVTGRCLCEQIVYEISGEFGPAVNCHCSKCRRWHNSAYRSRATVNAKQFRWLRGEELLTGYHSSEHVTKWFCSVCGSSLISTYADEPERVGVPLGGLDRDPGVVPEAHIFVAHKAPWFSIDDDLPQFDEWPEGDTARRAQIKRR